MLSVAGNSVESRQGFLLKGSVCIDPCLGGWVSQVYISSIRITKSPSQGVNSGGTMLQLGTIVFTGVFK